MKPKLDESDLKLFREAMRDVTPLGHDRHTSTPRRRAGRARFARAQRHAVLDESPHGTAVDDAVHGSDELSFRRPGVPDRVVRKLRRGEYPIVGELDLHGLTVEQARLALRDFLVEALSRRAGCVRIIHGKGLRSGHGGPVIKTFVSASLRRTSAVIAYVSARPADGGTGAVYVLLSTNHS